MSPRWALFLSGRGSNAQALLNQLDLIDVRLVVTSQMAAAGVRKARRMGIPVVLWKKATPWQEMDHELRARGISHLFLLGFMRLVPGEFCEAWRGRIWNLHPSLLPHYPGAHAMENSFSDRAEMGVTIHEVTAEMDAGPICRQERVWSRSQLSQVGSEDWPNIQMAMSMAEQRNVRMWAEFLNLKGAPNE